MTTLTSQQAAARRADTFGDSLLSDRVREILPAIEALVPEGEALRRAPQALLDLFTEVGFWRHFVPKCFGGSEGGVYDWLQAVRLVGSVDMSAAWTVGLASCHAPPYTYFDERLQEEMWAGNPDMITGTAGAPPAQASKVDGGVRLNGRLHFASGCDHVDWLCAYYVGEDEEGAPCRWGAMMPRGEYRIEDTWHVTGMRATGSNTVVLENVFVPDYRTAAFPVATAGRIRRTNGANLYRLSHWALFASAFGPLLVGGMETALRIFGEAMQKKVSAGSGKVGAESIPAQQRYAECLLKAEAAIALADARWREMDAQAEKGAMESIETFHRWKAIDWHVAQTATEVVEVLMNASSPSAHYESFPLQRFWRDIHVASRHVFLDTDSTLQTFVRHKLKLPRDKSLMFG